MDILEIAKVIGGVIGGGGLMLLFVKAKNRKLNAESSRTEAETDILENESSLDLLDQSFNSLVKIYDAKFKAQTDVFNLKFESMTMKHDLLQLEFDALRKHFEEKEQGYKLDLKLLAIHKLCAEEMKKCPNFATCPGAKLYHKLIIK